MNKKQGITTESSIYKIENGFLLTYVVTPYDHTVRLDSSEHKHDTEIYAAFDAVMKNWKSNYAVISGV